MSKRKYTEEDVRKWECEYRICESFKEVSEKFGVPRCMITRWFKKLNIKTARQIAKNLFEQGLKRCADCKKIKNLDDFWDISSGSKEKREKCKDCVRKRTGRNKREDTVGFDLEEVRKWAKEYERIGSFNKVAKIFGVSGWSVHNYLLKYQKEFGIVFEYKERQKMKEQGDKKCKDCNNVKNISEFKSGSAICKECFNKRRREKNATPEDKAKRKKYRKENTESIKAYKKEYRRRKEVKKRDKKRREDTKDERNAMRRANQAEKTIYERNKRNTDINYKISCSLRRRLCNAIRRHNKGAKVGSAVRDLGCSIEELKLYLEMLFYPNPETGEMMTWENYGFYGWHIDHIIPLSTFDLADREQFLKACCYTNLQPMWAKENLSKWSHISEEFGNDY